MISSKTTAKDMDLVREGLGSRLDNPSMLPISYAIDGKKYTGIPDEFGPVQTKRIIDSNIIERTWNAEIQGLSMRVEGFEYKDFPVFEWTVFFTNSKTSDSPVISDFNGGDFIINAPGDAVLYHNNGDYYSRDGLETKEKPLPAGESFTASSSNGRSCDRAWPYYRVLFENCGFNIAIGWPGTWTANFESSDCGLHFTAKQSRTNFYLKPGETVRSPRILFMAFQGDYDRGVNVWRNFYFAHVLPKSRGTALGLKTACTNNGGGEEFTLANENNQVEAITTLAKRGFRPEIWWIDAGWYPCKDETGVKHWPRTGDWRLDPEKWPNGLGPVGKVCKENGTQLLLWFEPERVSLKYWPDTNPSEYVLKIRESVNDKVDSNGLLYLGNPEAREWLTKRVKEILSEGGVEIYRQDFNGDPFPRDVWAQNDLEENRAGITENLHIQGYLKFWDDLLCDIPDLWIDSCASGGRRNDIEAMRRAVPLHPTDYGYGEHPVKQAFQKTWFEWTPYFRSINCSWDDEDGNYNTGKPRIHGCDSYSMHCSFATVSSFGANYKADDNRFNAALACDKMRKRAGQYLVNSDFYCLLPVRKSNEDYFSIQFNRPDSGEGLLQVIRNTRCEEPSVTVFPKGLDADSVYEFSTPETGETRTVKGSEINDNGFTVEIPKRSGIFWFYRKIGS